MSRFDAALDPKMAVDRPVASSPTEAQEVLRTRPRDRRPASDAPRWKRSAGRREPAPMRRRAAVTLATTTEFRFTSLWVRKRRTDGNF